MAEEFLVELYKNAELTFRFKQLIRYCRKDQVFLFQREWERLQERMMIFCKQVSEQNSVLGERIWTGIIETKRRIILGDYIGVADWLESFLLVLYEAMKEFGRIDVEMDNFRFYSSSSGFLCIENKGMKLCSDMDPAWEAYEKAEAMYHPWQKRFCTLGCGLGYLCWQMYEISRCSMEIFIYDIDNTKVDYARQFGVLDRIPEEQLHVIIEPSSQKLLSYFIENIDAYNRGEACLNIEKDSLGKEERYKETINDIFSAITSARNLFSQVERNYYCNKFSVKGYVTEHLCKKSVTKWIVVGGGPSVDEFLDYLMGCREKYGIIAATTIYKKLIDEGCKPDYIVAIDPQNRTYGHLAGVMDSSVPLLMTDTSNWQFGQKYQGEKYLIPTSGLPFAEEIYKAKGMRMWETEGTVPGMCIEMAVYFGAKEIELIGVDLAYADGHTHAKGTMDDMEIGYEGLIKVKSVTGGEVYTSAVFAEYIADMEEQIARHKNICFYNLSKNGAYIRGAKIKEN